MKKQLSALGLALLLALCLLPYAAASAEEGTGCVTFSGTERFKIRTGGDGGAIQWDGTIEYSIDGGEWTPWTGDRIEGTTIRLRGTGNTYLTRYSQDPIMYEGWKIDDTDGGASEHLAVTVSGDMEDLLDYKRDPGTHPAMAKSCFQKLFKESPTHYLVSAEGLKLPGEGLTEACCFQMFSGCENLTAAPALPATKLADSCYHGMFSGCTSLTAAPALPATELADSCYYQMFSGCTSLSAAPALPATKLAHLCYSQMFYGCTSLSAAPALPATELADSCYYQMFYGCTGLTAAPELPATEMADCCYVGMFNGCTSLTAAPALPATELAGYCYYQMFNGCSSLPINEFGGDAVLNAAGDPASWGKDMFTGTGGQFTGTPEAGKTYYQSACSELAAEPGSLDFGSLAAGYAEPPAAKTVRVLNLKSDTSVRIGIPTLPEAYENDYVIVPGNGFSPDSGTATLDPNGGSSASFTVRPAAGLSGGRYDTAVTVQLLDGGAVLEIPVSLTVGSVDVVVKTDDSVRLMCPEKDFVAAVLTDSDFKKLDAGEKISIEFRAKDVTDSIGAKEKAFIEQSAPGIEFAQFVDVSIVKTYGSGVTEAVSQTKNPIDLSIVLNGELSNRAAAGEAFGLVRKHDNDVDRLNGTVTEKSRQGDGRIVLEYAYQYGNDKFSLFAIGTVKNGPVPKTGDGNRPLLWAGMLLLAGAGLALGAKASLKKRG